MTTTISNEKLLTPDMLSHKNLVDYQEHEYNWETQSRLILDAEGHVSSATTSMGLDTATQTTSQTLFPDDQDVD